MTLPNPAAPNPHPRRTVRQVLLSYFYWTYPRGSFHYDIMVTLILLFIFLTPHIPGWNYGDQPSPITGPMHPMQVVADDDHGMIVTVAASDVNLDPRNAAPDKVVKKALSKAIEPVTGDAVFVTQWKTVTDAQGNLAWMVWVHR